MSTQTTKASYLRNFIFGVEDSLVSTVGLLSGIAIAGLDSKAILTTGIVLIFVEAFSMAAGSFLSEKSVEEFEGKISKKLPLADGTIMFASYFVAGLIPLLPYYFFTTIYAFKLSIVLALLSLFVLGTVGGIYTKANSKSVVRRGIRMAVIGGIAIFVGIVAGQITGM